MASLTQARHGKAAQGLRLPVLNRWYCKGKLSEAKGQADSSIDKTSTWLSKSK